ncbi:MAG: choice-of-anchor V domain-containing protein [Candidatus Binatia bacterium]
MLRSYRLLALLVVLVVPRTAAAYPFGAFGYAQGGCSLGGSCHVAVASPTTRVCIVGLPADGTYAPGTTYALNVFVDGLGVPPLGVVTGGNIAGFDVIATAGTIATPSEDDAVQHIGNDVTHTAAGTDRNHWDFQWTAPVSGEVTIYVAGNAVSGDGTNQGGDLWNVIDGGVVLQAGAGSGAGEGMTCNPPLPLPQLIRLPLEPSAMAAH